MSVIAMDHRFHRVHTERRRLWIEGDTWYLFYERGDRGVWLAKSTDRETWTNVQDAPVIARGPNRIRSPGHRAQSSRSAIVAATTVSITQMLIRIGKVPGRLALLCRMTS